MIIDKRIEDYICSLDEELPEYLLNIEKEALFNDVPIIKKPTQNLLRFIIRHNMPRTILEVGTAVGFSSLLMCEYMPTDGKILTIEKMESRFNIANNNINSAGRKSQIRVIKGDALEELSKIKLRFDMIFIDAAKGQYNNYFRDIVDKLLKGGVLICDNVLQDGDIANSRYAVTRRNRTIHTRMRDFLYMITHCDLVDTLVLPIGDGVTISYKK